MHHADRTSAPADVASPAPSPDPPSGFTLPPEPVLHAPEPLTSLYVTDFRRLLADPYLFALERILRLEPLDDAARELDGAAFGSLAHDVLQRFGKAPELHATDARAIAQRLNELLDAAAAERFGRHPLPAVRVQLEQLRVRLRGFAAWHAGRVRDGWRVVATEMAPEGGVLFDVDGEPVRLRGRIDRIDHHAESGAWAVLDYKTSEKAQDPDAVHRAGRGENRRWVDLQLPLYRHLLAAIPDAAAPADAMDRVQLGFVNLSRQDDRIAEAMASWTPDELAEADEMAREVVRHVRDNAFRFDETLAAGYRGPFAALLGQGHLVAAIEDDADAETDPAGAGPPGRAPAPRPPKVEAKA